MLAWKGNCLMRGSDTVASYVPAQIMGQYRVVWPDGTQSRDAYSLAQAKRQASVIAAGRKPPMRGILANVDRDALQRKAGEAYG